MLLKVYTVARSLPCATAGYSKAILLSILGKSFPTLSSSIVGIWGNIGMAINPAR